MATATQTRPGTQARTILVVEDERLLRWAIARNLRRAGYSVIEAGTGGTAMSAAARGGIDLVLLDVRLPDADGIQLIPGLRSALPAARVLLMSAFASSERVDRACQLGASGFIPKPFDQGALLENVAALLSDVTRRGA